MCKLIATAKKMPEPVTPENGNNFLHPPASDHAFLMLSLQRMYWRKNQGL